MPDSKSLGVQPSALLLVALSTNPRMFMIHTHIFDMLHRVYQYLHLPLRPHELTLFPARPLVARVADFAVHARLGGIVVWASDAESLTITLA
jgi:hypothetical protein